MTLRNPWLFTQTSGGLEYIKLQCLCNTLIYYANCGNMAMILVPGLPGNIEIIVATQQAILWMQK